MKREDSFRSNIFFSLFSNATIALVSALTIFILPKFLGIEGYGYWQLFVFYGAYALVLQLGAGDGASLRYAGLRKEDLLSRGVGWQALLVFSFTVTVSVCVYYAAPYIESEEARVLVLQLTAIYSGIINVRHFLLLQMQAIGNFRTFNKITVIDRSAFSILVVFLLIIKADFFLFAVAEILSKILTLIITMHFFRDVLMTSHGSAKEALKDLAASIYAGFKLTIANASSMLTLGIGRFLVDRTFGLAAFGSISLVLNFSSFFMIFVRAVGIVLLPMLRRSNQQELPVLFETVRLPLSVIPLMFLVGAYPLIELLSLWLPEYKDGIIYLGILMVLIPFETRMALLVDPYLKALRKENTLLAVNILALLISAFLGVLSTTVWSNLDLAILSIAFAVGLRTTLSEFLLLKLLNLKTSGYMLAESALVFISIFLNFIVGGWVGMTIMAVLVALYLFAWRKPLIRRTKTLLTFLTPGSN